MQSTREEDSLLMHQSTRCESLIKMPTGGNRTACQTWPDAQMLEMPCRRELPVQTLDADILTAFSGETSSSSVLTNPNITRQPSFQIYSDCKSAPTDASKVLEAMTSLLDATLRNLVSLPLPAKTLGVTCARPSITGNSLGLSQISPTLFSPNYLQVAHHDSSCATQGLHFKHRASSNDVVSSQPLPTLCQGYSNLRTLLS